MKKPSSVMGLYAKSGTGRECPEQIRGIFLEVVAIISRR
jgi:hypothetical protein